jgi:hypothetical protein
MKQPTEDDFTVDVLESSVTVLFEPTQSYYTFYRLADPRDTKQFGPVSPEPDGVRHAGLSGDTGDFRSGDGAFIGGSDEGEGLCLRTISEPVCTRHRIF